MPIADGFEETCLLSTMLLQNCSMNASQLRGQANKLEISVNPSFCPAMFKYGSLFFNYIVLLEKYCMDERFQRI